MKVIQIKYPDGIIHLVGVTSAQKTTSGELIITYNDYEKGIICFTPIVNINGKWYKNPLHKDYDSYDFIEDEVYSENFIDVELPDYMESITMEEARRLEGNHIEPQLTEVHPQEETQFKAQAQAAAAPPAPPSPPAPPIPPSGSDDDDQLHLRQHFEYPSDNPRLPIYPVSSMDDIDVVLYQDETGTIRSLPITLEEKQNQDKDKYPAFTFTSLGKHYRNSYGSKDPNKDEVFNEARYSKYVITEELEQEIEAFLSIVAPEGTSFIPPMESLKSKVLINFMLCPFQELYADLQKAQFAIAGKPDVSEDLTPSILLEQAINFVYPLVIVTKDGQIKTNGVAIKESNRQYKK